MRTTSLFAFLLVLFVASIMLVKADSDVIELSDEKFKATVNYNEQPWFIEFFAPWCGHCKKLAPIYEEVATTLKGQVNVAKVNVDVNSKFAEAFGVRGFPTIFFLYQNELRPYKGARTVEAFSAFGLGGYKDVEALPVPEFPTVIDRSGIPSDVIELNDENIDTLVQSAEPWLIEFYSPNCGHCKKLAPTYEDLATTFKGKVKVAKIDCVANKISDFRFQILRYPTIKLLFNNEMRTYVGPNKLSNLTAFVETGFSTVPAVPVPPVPSPIDYYLREIDDQRKEFEDWVYYRIWPAIGVIFASGLILGGLFGCVCCRKVKVVKVKKD